MLFTGKAVPLTVTFVPTAAEEGEMLKVGPAARVPANGTNWRTTAVIVMAAIASPPRRSSRPFVGLGMPAARSTTQREPSQNIDTRSVRQPG